MCLASFLIESGLIYIGSSYSLSEDLPPKVYKLQYNVFNPIISIGKMMIDLSLTMHHSCFKLMLLCIACDVFLL
jgi:hypothetical protein